jgi:glutathione S-transferase
MLKFYHAPWSRSFSIFWLLEELGVPYEMEIVDIRSEGGPPDSYRSIQPNKKVPAIEHDGVVVTERAAIAAYLADAFPATGFAPAVGSKMRGPYLTWLVYADAVMDPAITARAHGLEYVSNDYSFGTFDDLVSNLDRRLSTSPYIAGDSFTAADTQIGTSIHYTMNLMPFLPRKPSFEAYLNRLMERQALKRTIEKDDAMAARIPALASHPVAGTKG